MCCKTFWKRLVSFTITLVFGLLFVNIFQKTALTAKPQSFVKISSVKTFGEGNGISGGGRSGRGSSRTYSAENIDLGINNSKDYSPNIALNILSKPRVNYTNLARQNNVEGTVLLHVTFLADGTIGAVTVINGLPDGLTEQAIAAARNIKFEPAVKNHIPQTISKKVQYSFTIY